MSCYKDTLARAMTKCEAMLGKHSLGPSAFTPDQVVLIRRTVMLAMVLQNAIRQSAVYGMTVDEAWSAR